MNYNWSPYAIGGATRPDSFTRMTPEMQAGLYGLLQAADAEIGGGLQVYSGYRSPELQAQLWKNALKKYGSPEKARKWVAPPGRSRHNSGQAADLKYNGTRIDRLAEDHPARVWLTENVGRFGLSQPMSWEPWQVEVSGARGQPLTPANSTPPIAPAPQEEQPLSFEGIMAALSEPDTTQKLGGILGQVSQPAAPQAPQIMPRQVQPLQLQRRETTQPYLALFQQLMAR